MPVEDFCGDDRLSRHHETSDVRRNCEPELTSIDAQAASDRISDGEDVATGIGIAMQMFIFIAVAVVVVLIVTTRAS